MTRQTRTAATRAAEKAAEVRREQQHREARRRNAVVAVAVVGVLLAVLGIGYAVQSSRDTTGGSDTAPAGADGYALVFGKADAPVTVDLHEDPMCPVCGQLEAVAGGELRGWVRDGTARIVLHPRSFLDDRSTTDYSSRAVNALAVTYDEAGPAVAEELHDLLYADQPAEGSAGLSDAQLVDLAVRAGAERAQVAPGIEDQRYADWVANAEVAGQREGVNGTPTVFVDGKQVDLSRGDPVTLLRQAVQAAQQG